MRKKITSFLGGLLIALGLGIIFIAKTATPAEATFQLRWCHRIIDRECHSELRISCNQGWHEGKCEESATPTPTPTIISPCQDDGCEPTPTPTIDPCQLEKGDCDEITPTPTPTEPPQNPGGPGDGRSDGGSSTSNTPASPSCTVPIEAPILQGFKKTSPTSVFWSWWRSVTDGIQKQWLEYGYAKGVYPYNVTIDPSLSGYEVGALDPNAAQNWSRVCVMKNDCVACSADLDP